MDDSQINESAYSQKSFWQKVRSGTKKAGSEVIYNALVLYHTAQADKTPTWCKSVILGTLGYFISIIDAIPDITPVLGYSDDLTLMLTAIGTLAVYVTPEIKAKAKHQTSKLFGEEVEGSVKEVEESMKEENASLEEPSFNQPN